MSTIPVKPMPIGEPAESLEAKFQRLAASWRSETAYISSTSQIMAHPAFQEIVRMGPAVIPFILREIEKRPGQWHRALRLITGADPGSTQDRGNIGKAAEAWLRWGKEQGYEW